MRFARHSRSTPAAAVLRVALAAAVLGSLPPLASARAEASCSSTDDCLRAVEAAQRETRTLAADFVQVKKVSLLEEPLESRGHLLFARPDRVRLQIEEPRPATVVVDGPKIHIPNLSESDRKALAMTPMATMFGQLGSIFTGSVGELKNNFDVTAESAGDGVRLVLIPRAESWKRAFQRIEVRFTGAELTPSSIALEDSLGDSLTVTLSNVRLNVEVPDGAFTP